VGHLFRDVAEMALELPEQGKKQQAALMLFAVLGQDYVKLGREMVMGVLACALLRGLPVIEPLARALSLSLSLSLLSGHAFTSFSGY